MQASFAIAIAYTRRPFASSRILAASLRHAISHRHFLVSPISQSQTRALSHSGRQASGLIILHHSTLKTLDSQRSSSHKPHTLVHPPFVPRTHTSRSSTPLSSVWLGNTCFRPSSAMSPYSSSSSPSSLGASVEAACRLSCTQREMCCSTRVEDDEGEGEESERDDDDDDWLPRLPLPPLAAAKAITWRRSACVVAVL